MRTWTRGLDAMQKTRDYELMDLGYAVHSLSWGPVLLTKHGLGAVTSERRPSRVLPTLWNERMCVSQNTMAMASSYFLGFVLLLLLLFLFFGGDGYFCFCVLALDKQASLRQPLGRSTLTMNKGTWGQEHF